LRWSDRSLSRVGEELGYATLPNFVRAFKRWTGRTPAAYRRSQRAAQHTPAVDGLACTERV
jgi:AraC-like DNA-binding protein